MNARAAWTCPGCSRSDGRYGCRPKMCGAQARLQAGMPIEQLGTLKPKTKATPKPKPAPAMSPPHAIENPPREIHTVLHGTRLSNPFSLGMGTTVAGRMGRATRDRKERSAAYVATRTIIEASGLPRLPLTIEIVRVAPATLDDDNCAGAAKHVRDGIADAIGIDDRDARLKFEPKQIKRGRGVYAVEIVISTRSA